MKRRFLACLQIPPKLNGTCSHDHVRLARGPFRPNNQARKLVRGLLSEEQVQLSDPKTGRPGENDGSPKEKGSAQNPNGAPFHAATQ